MSETKICMLLVCGVEGGVGGLCDCTCVCVGLRKTRGLEFWDGAEKATFVGEWGRRGEGISQHGLVVQNPRTVSLPQKNKREVLVRRDHISRR